MRTAGTDETPEEVTSALKAINRSWLEGNPEAAGPLFHEDVLVLLTGFTGRVRGRDALVKSFVEFCSNASIQRFEESRYEVDVIGSTAIATYTFEMSYSMGGKSYEGSGRDVWGFSLEGGKWLATWRFMTDLSEREVESDGN